MIATTPKIWQRTDKGDVYSLSFELTDADYLAFRRSSLLPLPFWPWTMFVGLIGLAIALVFAWEFYKQNEWIVFWVIMVAVIPTTLLVSLITFGTTRNLFDAFWLGFIKSRRLTENGVELTLDEQGFEWKADGHSSNIVWDRLYALEEHDERYYFNLTQGQGYVLPKRAFADIRQREDFRRSLENWIGFKGGLMKIDRTNERLTEIPT